jgi:hypothetical protein
MGDVSKTIDAIVAGEENAADRLLPLVYEEMRRIAAIHMARESPGQTLDPTGLQGPGIQNMMAGSDPADCNHLLECTAPNPDPSTKESGASSPTQFYRPGFGRTRAFPSEGGTTGLQNRY